MKLWIRTQDKKKLLEAENVWVDSKTYSNVNNYNSVAIYQETKDIYATLTTATGWDFDIASNFVKLNATLEQFNKNCSDPVFSPVSDFDKTLLNIFNKKGKVTIEDVLHHALLKCPNVELVETLHYSAKGGKLQGNILLMD